MSDSIKSVAQKAEECATMASAQVLMLVAARWLLSRYRPVGDPTPWHEEIDNLSRAAIHRAAKGYLQWRSIADKQEGIDDAERRRSSG